jgi:hypothetical protein
VSRTGILWISVILTTPAWSQNRVDGVHNVDPSAIYHRIYAVVPLIGAGTKADPKRPMFTPAPPQVAAAPSQTTSTSVAQTGATPAQPTQSHTGIIAYQMQISDDGNFALVEFVGANAAELRGIINPSVAGVQAVFERGMASAAQIEAAFQQYKKGFQMSWFGVRAQ